MAVTLSIFIISKLQTMWERVRMMRERVGTMLERLGTMCWRILGVRRFDKVKNVEITRRTGLSHIGEIFSAAGTLSSAISLTWTH